MIDLNRLIETPYFAIDHLLILSGVRSFLQFSEQNIEQQKPIALLEVESDVENKEFESPEQKFQYRDQMIESANFRFDVALPMRVRYAALTAFTSTVEWSMAAVDAKFQFSKRPTGTSWTVHRLTELSARCHLSFEVEIRRFQFLEWVRNSIMHQAGVLKGYQHEADIRALIPNYEPGFTISNWHHIGDTVEIRRGALEPHIKEWDCIIRELLTQAHKKGLLR